jgi:DNA-binding MarR family transcriptional regulator
MAGAYESTLRELCGSEIRYRLLRALYEQPGRSFHLRGLAAAARIDPGNAHRLLRRLAGAGLVEEVKGEGPSRYAARRDNPLFRELVALFSRASALISDLRAVAEEHVDGVAAVFGSLAAGEDRADSDIDVLAVTPASQILVQAAFMPIARKHGRDINVKAISATALRDELRAGSGFWRGVIEGPLILLKGEISDALNSDAAEGGGEGIAGSRARSAHHRKLDRGKRREAGKRGQPGPKTRPAR